MSDSRENESGFPRTSEAICLTPMNDFVETDCADNSETRQILRQWTAKDFADCYVKFTPLIVQHAKKFLQDPNLAEDVAQEAFLYLMTALPELDSEVGVLRYLKWKTKMLAIDIGRSAQNSELLAGDGATLQADRRTEIADQLSQADDASIVRLALAKLNPNQRSAVVMSAYEGKSHGEIADSLGISETASRQLLFRAREVLRSSLASAAEQHGLTMSSFLSQRLRKLSTSAGKAAASGLCLVLFLIPIISTESGESSIEEVSAIEQVQIVEAGPNLPIQNSQLSEPTAAAPSQMKGDSAIVHLHEEVAQNMGTEELGNALSKSSEPAIQPDLELAATAEEVEFIVQDAILFGQNRNSKEYIGHLEEQLLVIELSENIRLRIGLSEDSEVPVQWLVAEITTGDFEFVAVPRTTYSWSELNSGVRITNVGATDFIVGDLQGDLDYAAADLSAKLDVSLVLEDSGLGIITVTDCVIDFVA